MRKQAKARRIIVIVLLSLTTLIALLFLIVPKYIEHKVSKEIKNSIESNFFAEVSIGSIDISLRKGNISCTNIEITGTEIFVDKPMLSISKLEISVSDAIKPSLKNIVFNQVNLENLNLYIWINNDGENCWAPKNQDIIDNNSEMPDMKELPKFSFLNLNIVNTNIHYFDERNDTKLQFVNLSAQIINRNESQWDYKISLENINTKIKQHCKATPYFSANGEITNTEQKLEITGTQSFNQLITTSHSLIDKENLISSVYEFSIPECSYRSFLSIFRPIINLDDEKFSTQGTVSGKFKLTGDLSYINIPNIIAELHFNQTSITNLQNDSSLYIDLHANTLYNPNEGIVLSKMNKEIDIQLGSNELALNFGLAPTNKKSNILGSGTGMIQLDDFNALIQSPVYKFSGIISSNGLISGIADTNSVDISTNLNIDFSDLRITNTTTNTNIKLNTKINWQESQLNIASEFTRSNDLTYINNIQIEQIFESLYLNEKLAVNIETQLQRVSLSLPETSNNSSSMLSMLDSSKSPNLNSFYPQKFDFSWLINIDTLLINKNAIENFQIHFIANNNNIGFKNISLHQNKGSIHLNLLLKPLSDTLHQLQFNQKANKLPFGTDSTPLILGNFNSNMFLQMNISSQGIPAVNSMNGYANISPDNVQVLQKKILKKTNTNLMFTEDLYLPLKTDSIQVIFNNGDIELLPFVLQSNQSGIRGKGYIYQLDSLNFDFNIKIANNYQSPSFLLVMKGIALMQKTKFEATGKPVTLGIKIQGNIKKPAFSLHIIE